MHILHIIDSSGLYGAESVLLNLAVEQKRQGHEPLLVSIGNHRSPAKPVEIEASKRGIECIALRMRDGINIAGARRIFRLATERKMDVIHSHGYKLNILLGCMPKSWWPCPIVATLHGWTAKRTLSKMGIYRFFDQALLTRLDAVVVVNRQLMQSPCIRKLNANKTFWIANGIATEPPTNDEWQQIAGGPRAEIIRQLRKTSGHIIGSVGRLSEEKNFGSLLEAVHLLIQKGINVGAVILGDGPQAEYLRRLIDERDLHAHVQLLGFVPDAGRYLRLFDALAIPSLTEGLPITLLEAMTAKLPIVATRVGDIESTLNGLGVIVQPGSSQALAEGIATMLADFAHYQGQAALGPQRVLEQFSASTMAASYEKVYRSANSPKRYNG